jgi:hypothetical protein
MRGVTAKKAGRTIYLPVAPGFFLKIGGIGEEKCAYSDNSMLFSKHGLLEKGK